MVVDSDNADGATGLDLAEDLRRAVGSFVRAVRSISDSLPAGHGEVLGALDRDGPQSVAALARKRGVRHQSMRITVRDLEAAGLVSRAADPDDARSALVSVTARGGDVLERDRTRRREIVAVAADTALNSRQRALLDQMPEILDLMAASVRVGANRKAG
ncbi:MarR family winged helix-turn-helix transcriptional regulator [Gordonia sp. SL306]|uniref:MarR family winged helix-turn-helix transcriptional regulator n=1 Tax=Gordonia sp. SL306 TaxID=2995145 RepID=UPI0022722187|nr:MarR family transcriptional regulator [Gordonia sp. SL306]WAC55763.1 MarR family transcriptional regulator [Gordonia sp. SL306]